MRRKMNSWCKVVYLLSLVAVIAAAGVTLTSGPAEAGLTIGPIGPPLCGWSSLWDCTLPDGKVVVIGGTQCDIYIFEQQTGATCVLHRF